MGISDIQGPVFYDGSDEEYVFLLETPEGWKIHRNTIHVSSYGWIPTLVNPRTFLDRIDAVKHLRTLADFSEWREMRKCTSCQQWYTTGTESLCYSCMPRSQLSDSGFSPNACPWNYSAFNGCTSVKMSIDYYPSGVRIFVSVTLKNGVTVWNSGADEVEVWKEVIRLAEEQNQKGS